MVTRKPGSDEREGDTTFHFNAYQPERSDKPPPCYINCPSGTPVRDWIAEVAQAPEDEAARRAAYQRAWRLITVHNPFPATMGRICPHPCESSCNRSDVDGPLAINILERFLGDWAIARDWALPVCEDQRYTESIGVIGAGPAGLSFAYQMKRRGYPVTVYERHPRAGGMLRYGVPGFRLPPDILDAELARIFQTGIELVAPIRIGIDLEIAELQKRHTTLFLGLGAQLPRRLSLPGESGDHVWSGIEYLEMSNEGAAPELGDHVVVTGGGNTAIDVARAARRAGSAVTVLYRRRREDMPAIAEEVELALEEGVTIRFLAIPRAVIRGETGSLTAVQVQKLQIAGRENDGRARVEPVPGGTETLLTSSFISAVSQDTDWRGLEGIAAEDPGLQPGLPDTMAADTLVCLGGDVTGLDVASHAIGQGRIAAEQVHNRLRGIAAEDIPEPSAPIVKPDHYPVCERAVVAREPVSRRLSEADLETSRTISEEAFLREVSRCFSCGLCNGCGLCWMYCGGNGFALLDSPRPGQYFAFSTDECTGCGKCIELCPTGFIDDAS